MKYILTTGFLIVVALGCRQKKEAMMPSFNLLLMDSTTILNTAKIPTDKPVVVMYFSPDCEHCQNETKDLIKYIDVVKDINFYFVTIDPLERLRTFDTVYDLQKYPNITLCRDYTFYIFDTFRPTGTPFIIVYNKKKELRAIYVGGAKPDQIVQSANKL